MNKEKIIINLPLTPPLLKEEYIRNKYMSMWLKTLNKEFREKINNEISNWNNKEDFLDYSKKIFWFNKENGWNFLCSVMDNIWDTTLVIEEYKNKPKLDSKWQELIYLYWVLNAIYAQYSWIQELAKLLWIKRLKPQISELRNTISHISNLDYWKNAYYFSSEVKDWTFSIHWYIEWDKYENINVYEYIEEYEKEIISYYREVIKTIFINIEKNNNY